MNKQKILIVDNQIELCKILKSYFGDKGYEVVYSLTGQGGLDAFESEHPYVMILDLHLKDMPGVEVLKKIKSIKRPCIVIITTTSLWEPDEKNCIKLGADFYIQKPVSIEALTKLLAKVIAD